MIQDIAPKKYDNQFTSHREPKMDDPVLVYQNNGVLLNAAKAERDILEFPKVGDLPGRDSEIVEESPGIYRFRGYRLVYLFAIDEEAFYGIEENEFAWPDADGIYAFRPVPMFRDCQPGYLAFAGITGHQMIRWRRDHRFCGRCGVKMRPSETERAFICPDCGAIVYPKISPAVIVGVIHEGKILVSRYAGRGTSRNYALLAGFAETGETIEETVHREVMEEVGIRVKNLRYYKSQPWSFSDTLLMGFYCELDGDDAISLDQEELAMAAWLSPEELPERTNEISMTAEMMENFRTGKIDASIFAE